MLTTYVPASSVLQQYIDVFYVFNAAPNSEQSYLAFPHTNTGLSLFKGVDIDRKDNSVLLTPQQTHEHTHCMEILGKYTKPVFVNYKGPINEVAIIFKPLGINRFIREDVIDIAPDFSQAFTSEAWLTMTHNMFYSHHPINYLEDFLLSVLAEKDDMIKMQQAITLFGDKNEDYSVADVANKLGMNLKTFQRNFTKMMACSPSDYKRIARFRNSLKSRLHSRELRSLTSISYENNYTDQSYFIREFRKLTGQNPKHFFKDISLIDGEKIIWEIL